MWCYILNSLAYVSTTQLKPFFSQAPTLAQVDASVFSGYFYSTSAGLPAFAGSAVHFASLQSPHIRLPNQACQKLLLLLSRGLWHLRGLAAIGLCHCCVSILSSPSGAQLRKHCWKRKAATSKETWRQRKVWAANSLSNVFIYSSTTQRLRCLLLVPSPALGLAGSWCVDRGENLWFCVIQLIK